MSRGLTECKLKEVLGIRSEQLNYLPFLSEPFTKKIKLLSPLLFVVGVVLSLPIKRKFTLTTGPDRETLSYVQSMKKSIIYENSYVYADRGNISAISGKHVQTKEG